MSLVTCSQIVVLCSERHLDYDREKSTLEQKNIFLSNTKQFQTQQIDFLSLAILAIHSLTRIFQCTRFWGPQERAEKQNNIQMDIAIY